MSENITRFDEKKLEEYIIQFALAVREQDGIEFQSFSSSAYLTRSESYKQSIYQEGHAICMGIGQKGMNDEKVLNEIQRALKCGSSGKGAPASFYNVTKFMEIARKDGAKAAAAFRDFYLKDNEEKGYNEICDLGCCRYDILALLAFYKDCNRYLPIRSSEFAKRFQMLGYTVELAGRYDWDSYHRDYLDAISEVRKVLIEYLDVSSDAIAFLDAHSFVWLLPQYEKLAGERVKKFILNPKGATGKATVVRQRAGQSEYRKNLISLWDGKCSVTGCGNTSMLTASHIKPWKDSNEGAVESGSVQRAAIDPQSRSGI